MKKPMEYFKELSKIPRGSANEKEASEMVLNFAKKLGLEAKIDSNNNVYIIKNASEGFGEKEAILLQGHIDMVCEKNEGVVHDFEKDAIKLIEKDGILTADGTTLGADDGVAIAYMMAIMEDSSLKHPRVEMLITTEEETGLWGAKEVDPSMFKATKMINIDAGPEGNAVCGCVGGIRGQIEIDEKVLKATGNVAEIKISGLKGGHSGADIHLGRKNANVLAFELLDFLTNELECNIVSINGGEKDNVIARECKIQVEVKCVNELSDKIEKFTKNLDLISDDSNLDIKAYEISGDFTAFENTKQVINIMKNIKSGPLEMSEIKQDMIVSSCNIGVVSTTEEKIEVQVSVRDANDDARNRVLNEQKGIIEKFGGKIEFSEGYPGWDYKEKSGLRDVMSEVYEEMYGKKLQIEVIHAGLECGLLLEKMPHLDIVAIGPNTEAIHSPDESLEIASFERVYEYLCKVLERA